MSSKLNSQELSEYIDHTLLRPDASQKEIEQTCAEAKEFRFKGVCVDAKWLPIVVPLLKGTSTLAVTVVGFPSGSVPTAEKAKETETAKNAGAQEIDMVLNREWLKEKNYSAVFNDIAAVVKAAGAVPVKVILETSELTREEKILACGLSKAAGAKFVKTSTGFSKSGATVEDVALMRSIVGKELGVKASGGVRNLEQALAMIEAGATRLGTSAGVAIVKGLSSTSGGY